MDYFGDSTTGFTARTAAAMEKCGGPTTQTRKKKVPLRKQCRFAGVIFAFDLRLERDGMLPSLINRGRRHGCPPGNLKPSPATPSSDARTMIGATVFPSSITSLFATS